MVGSVALCLAAVLGVALASEDAHATAPPSVPAPSVTDVGAAGTMFGAAVPLFGSTDEFVARWNAQMEMFGRIDPALETTPIDPAALIVGSLPESPELGRLDMFAAPITTSGFVGGLVDPDSGAVIVVIVGGDPDASALRLAGGALLTTTLDLTDPGLVELSDAWKAFASDPAFTTDYVVTGDIGTAMFSTEGAAPDDPLIAVVMASAQDEPVAVAVGLAAMLAVATLAVGA